MLKSPGVKGQGRPPVCDLRERLSCSGLNAGVPAAVDGIQERFDIWLAVAMIDLAGCADVVAEQLRWHDEIGAVAANMAMQGFLNADRTVPSLNVDLAQKRAARLVRIALDLSHAKRRVAAVTELDHWESGKRERENINFAWLRRPSFATAGAIQIAVAHVDDGHVLAMTAGVLVVSIVRPLAPGGADQFPILALRFLGIAIFDAFRTASLVPARRGGFDAVILTPICVAAAKPEEAVMAIAFRVRPD